MLQKILKKPLKLLTLLIVSTLLVAVIGAIIYFLVLNTVAVPKGAVATNGHKCSEIGADILQKGGTAMDAAIAALFCEGVSMPHSMGLGGGFLMTIYQKSTGKAWGLNAREMAPSLATETMFNDNATWSQKGGLAVGVPGELKGYYEAYKRFGGKIAWKDLIQPTIELCEKGILVTDYLGRFFGSQTAKLKLDPFLAEVFIDPKTDFAYAAGQVIYRKRLADTLRSIANEGADALYNGTLTQKFVDDIRKHNGIITVEDMKNYTVEWQEAVMANISSDKTLFSSPLPGSGAILAYILNILNGFLDIKQLDSVLNWQHIIESFKFGYARRTELGDPKFVDVKDLVGNLTTMEYATEARLKIFDSATDNNPEYYGAKMEQPIDHGTAHISVLAPNGDAISVTSTINLYFGAGFMSESTGIILNDQMDDFSSPNRSNSFGLAPSVANYIKPGKRPLSSMCPSIIVDNNGDPILVIGSAGGSKITTSIAQITIKNLLFGASIGDAVSAPRIHHQLVPMEIEFESPFAEKMDFVDAFKKIGHTCKISAPSDGFSAVIAISRKDNEITAATDRRRTGEYTFVY